MKLCRSFTTLSTIAIHAGQSQIIISVLKSGSLVHLQLVQVQPGLCEIGSDQEENHMLIQEQQQLLEKLEKHEPEVLSVVEKKDAELRRREGRKMKQEEEEELSEAMEASLREGWSLLLLLLKRRLEVLKLASDFYHRALEFSASIDRFEDLQIEDSRPTEGRSAYDSVKRGVLGKSLQVLSSSSVLLQKLRQLQKTEALQRRGGVLQEEEEEEEEHSRGSWSSRGPALMLEELVEKLQDRRRKVDQTVRLKLQQAENIVTVLKTESMRSGSDIRSLPDGNILDQNLQFGSTSADLKSKTRTTRPGSRSDQTGDVGPQRRSDDSMKLKSRLISDLQTQFWAEPKSPTRSEEPGKSGSGSDQQPEDPVRARPEETELRADEEINSGLNLNSESRSEDLKPGSGSDETRSGLFGSVEPQHGSSSEGTRTFSPGSRSDLKTRSEPIRDLTSGSQQEPEETKDSQTVFSSVLENRSSSEVKPGDPRPGSGSDETEKRQHGWRLVKIRDLQAGFRSAMKPRPGSEETQVQKSGTGSEIQSLPDGNILDQNLQFGSTSADLQSKTRTTRPGSRSDQTGDVGPQRRSDDSMKLKSRFISDLQTQFWAEPNSPTRSEEPGKSGSGSDQQPEDPVRAGPEETELRADEEINSGLNLNSEDLKPGSGSDETRSGLLGSVEPQHGSRSEGTRIFSLGSRSDLKTRSEQIRDLTSGSQQEPEETKDSQTVFSSVLENRSSSEVKPGDPRPGSGLDETEKRQHGWRLVKIRDLQAGFRSALKPRPGSEQNQVQMSGTGSEIRSLPDGNIVDQNLQFGSTSADLQSKTRTTRPGSRSDQTGDVGPQRRSDDSTKLKSRLISDLQTQFWAEPKSPTRSEEPGKSGSGSDQQPEDPVRAGPEETELRADEEINSGLNLNSESRSEDLKPGSGSDETRSGLLGSVEPQHGSSSEGTRTFSLGSRSDLKTRSEQIRDLTSGSQQEPEETKDSQTVFSSVLENRSSSEVKLGDPRPGSGSDETEKRQHGWRLVKIRDLQAGFRSALKPRPGSEQNQVQMSGTGSEIRSLPDGNILDQNLQFGSTSADLQSKTRTTRPGSRSDQTGDVGPQRRSEDSMKLKSRLISDLQTQFWAEPKSPTLSEEPGKSGSGSDQQPEDPVRAGPEETELRADEEINSGLNLNSESRSEDLKPGSGSDETRSGLLGSVEPQHGSRSEETRTFSLGSRSDLKTRSEQIRDLTSGSQQEPEETKDSQTVFSSVLENRSSSEVKLGDPRPGSGSDETEKRQHGWRLVKIRDLQAGFRSALKPRPGSEETQVQMSGTGSEIRSLPDGNIVDQNLQFGSTSADLQSKTRTTRPGSRSDQTGDVGPQRRSDDSMKLKSRLISDLQTQFWAEPNSPTRSEEPGKSGSGSDQQPEDPVRAGPEETELRADEEINSGLNLNSESRSEDLKPGSGSDETRSGLLGSVEPQHRSRSEETRTFSPGSRSDLKTRSEPIRDLTSGSRQEPEETKDSQTVFSSVLENRSSSEVKPGDPRPGSGSDETEKRQHGWRLVKIRDLQAGFRSALKPRPGSEQNQVQKSGTGSEIRSLPDGNIVDQNLLFGSTSADLQSKTRTTRPGSRSDQTGDVGPQRRSDDSTKLKSRLISDLQTQFWAEPKSPTRSEEPGKSRSGSDQQPEDPVRAGPEETELRADEEINSGLNLNSEDLKPGSGSDETRSGLLGSVEPQHGSSSEGTRTFSPGSRSDLKTRSEQIRDLTSGSQQEPEETKDSQTVFSSVLENRSSSEVKPGDPRPGSGSDETEKRQHGWRLVTIRDLQAGFRSALKPRPGSEETQVQMSGTGSEVKDGSSQVSSNQDGPICEKPNRDGTDQNPAAGTGDNGQTTDQQSMLGNEIPDGEDHAHRSLPAIQRQQLLMAFEYLEKKVNVWMQQSSSVLASSSEGVRQLSEAEHTLNTHLELQTQAQSAGRDVQNLKQILDQLGPTSRTSRTGPSTLKALTEQLRGGTTGSGSPPAGPAELSGRLDLVLKEQQSLETRISSNLQTLQPFVIFLRTAQQGEEEMADLREMSRRRDGEEEAAGKTRVETYRQKVLHAEELGNGCIQAATMVLGSALNLELVQETVRQTMQRLSETKEEVDELRAHHQNQNQNQMFWRRHQERLMKTHQDLNCVSELLDSCTLMDLGSDLQTSRLLDHFRQASPHFRQLDDEVENVVKTWEGLRGVPDHLEEAEEELAELLELQKTVTEKIQQSESILDLSSSFHLTAKQLEVLLQSEPSSSSAGSAEARQQIQNLLKTASTLKSDVCAAVTQSRQTGFQVERLEARFDSLDSRCRSWLNEAARCEEKQRREQVTRLLLGDINQLRDSFKDVKKRFSNTKFNYLKRNDRTRNVKAVRNQLQQVELYEEKLQALRKRVHGVAARLGSEVRDGGVVRQVEDAINELQRQMGELERSVREHQKTLDMTCRLQQAMEEYQFWCEEASATIARVGKFSTECRSTEAASVLYRQFEKFVWPTVPQQEERISQIAELAVRLHGAEEGRRYIEKTVSKHSEMVASIRELSDGLMELEAKLKSESLRRQNDEEEEDRSEQRTEKETEEKENKMKEKKKVKKKKQKDDRSTQEAADMCELKETGHTPELTAEHDGKEVRSGREVLSEIRQSNSERFTSSYCASFSISTEANRQVNVVHSQSQPVVTESRATKPPSAIGPSFSDIQKEFQKKELKETLHQTISTCCASTAGPSQDASAEEELQQQEVAMEDSLSNDEYDCVSPDDMSLPPLAETPESNMFQSDVEESFCFSSHSVHISQYSQQCLAQSEPAGTGAVPQQEESIQREGCPTSSISLHNRLRTGSSGLVQSPMTVPSPRLFTSTLCTILKTRTTSTDNYKKSADLSLDSPEPTHRCGSNLVHDNKSTNGLFKDDYVPERKSPSPSTKEINDNVPSLNSDLSPACCPEPPREKCGPCDPQCQAVAWENTSLTKSIHGSDSRLHQDMNPKQRSTETTPQREGLSRASTSLGTQQNIYLQSSESHCVASQDSNISAEETPSSLGRTKPQVDPVLTTKSFTATPNIPDPVGHKHVTHPWDADLLQPCTTTAQTITKPSEEIKMSQSTTGLRSVLNQIVPSSETSKDAAATQRPVHCNSQHEGSFNQGTFDPPDGQTNVPPHTNTISNIRFHKQSSQTVHSLHGSLPSAHVQQCVHGPGMSPSSPTQPRPEAQTQALSQQANLHVTPPPSPPHLLTPTQDPDICHPMVIREEIRLTPQIQGPPLPPPHPPHLAQAESLPQGKASRSGPPCFTRPLSQATVMEGSPVTLEVEVMGHPEPKLTWLKDGEVSARLAPPCDQGKHFLFLPESDGGLKEARAAGGQDSQRTAGTSSGGGGWLVAEVLDIISVDWYTWFGTLCVLLWLIYLIIL